MTIEHSPISPKGAVLFLIVTLGPAAIAYWQFASHFRVEPEIVEFRFEPSTVFPGDHATLVWNVVNAERVLIQPDIGAVAASDSRPVHVAAARKYTLTATRGSLVKIQELTITPAEPPTPVVELTGEPNPQLRGERFTLTWVAKDADTVFITGIGEVPPTGSREETAFESRTYEITAANRFRKKAIARLGVSVQEWPEPTLALRAEPNPVVADRQTELYWQSQFAKRVVIEQLGPVPVSGSASIAVDKPLTVTGRAEGPGGVKIVTLYVDAIQRVTLVIPRNQELRARLLSPMGSALNHAEEEFEATLGRDVRIGGATVAAAGTRMWGRVIAIRDPGRVRGRASIELTLERLTLVDGTVVALETEPVRKDRSSLGKDLFRTLVTTGVGAGVGAAAGGGEGAAKGAAAGAAAGAGASLVERGDDVVLPSGFEIGFHTRRPLTIEIAKPR